MTRKASLIWLVIAALCIVVYWIASLNNVFYGEANDWASAHMAMLAHSFVQFGVLHLHGMPMQNYPPLGSQPDFYNHWPPLYPILLSVFFRLFGETPAVIHGFVVLVNLFYWAAFYLLIKRCYGTDLARWALFVMITLPAFTTNSRLVWTPNAALAAICIALYCYLFGTEENLKWKWIVAGAIALSVGVAFSWEAAPLGFVLLFAELWNRSRPRRTAAIVYSLAGLVTAGAIFAIFFSASADLRDNLLYWIRYYMGHAPQEKVIPIHAWMQYEYPTTHVNVFSWAVFLNNTNPQSFGGNLGVVAALCVLTWTWLKRKTEQNSYFLLAGFLGVFLIWIVVFPNHIFINRYEILMAVPVLSISMALCIKLALEKLTVNLRWIVLLFFPALLMIPLVLSAKAGFKPVNPDTTIKYAYDVRANTPEGAVVLSSLDNQVDVYYSHRQIIRGVHDDDAVSHLFPQAEAIFPGSELYLAIQPQDLKNFPCAASRLYMVKQTPDMILYQLKAGDCKLPPD